MRCLTPGVLFLLALLSWSTVVRAQDLVPGAYTPAPIGFTILNISGVFSDGAIAFDPSLPIEDAHSTVGAMGIGIARTLSIGGRFANVGVGIPLVFGHVEGLVLDQFQEASRAGQGDIGVRVAINLYGAPAMTRQQFAAYRATTIVGVSLGVGAPLGQYDSTKYVNLGTNRWSFRPELGIMRTRGAWTFEGDIGAVFFTDNTNYVNGATRGQAPIVGLQGHLIRTFRPGFWVAADANYWKGGRLTINGDRANYEQENSRIGATLAYPVRRHQLRFSYSFGAYTTIGGDFQSLGMSYNYAWASRQ
jgi:hypothetical protein